MRNKLWWAFCNIIGGFVCYGFYLFITITPDKLTSIVASVGLSITWLFGAIITYRMVSTKTDKEIKTNE